MRFIDLRSDTVTKPTEAMRKAMYEAEVGDDVYRDDPTVIKLQKLAAELTGKEDALFLPSGTMGNQLAVMTHTRRSDEIIMSDECHIAMYEIGGAAALSGVMIRTWHSDDHLPHVETIRNAIRADGNVHYPTTSLIVMENPTAKGRVVPLENLKEVYEMAKARGISVHMDGARLFNAAIALGCKPADIAQYCDSVQFCLSKGLCAPIGSMICGSREFIARALRNRKMMGGGLRQVGVLAAPGIVALTEMVDRLADDHKTADILRQRLSKMPGVKVDWDLADINMVYFTVDRPLEWQQASVAKMKEQGILVSGPKDGYGGPILRWVTSHEVNEEDVNRAADVFESLLAE